MKSYDKLTLWDIDNTTVKGIGAHLESFPYALKKVYGVEGNVRPEHHGLTDRRIIFDILREKGFSDSEIESNLPECFNVMTGYFTANIDKYDIITMPGARNVLEELERHNVLMGVVTGNIGAVAKGKIEKVGLEHYFEFGGFGNESNERSDLVRIAIERAEKGYGFKNNNNVYLFDDTPIGIEAGKAAMVKAIGVATGNSSVEQLREAGADDVLENLMDPKKVLKLLNI